MIGDQSDILGRLRLTLPGRWFADTAPVLEGVLSGFASAWVELYNLLQYVIRQSRLLTATDNFLDMAAVDYLSSGFLRRVGEADQDYRSRLLAALQRNRATRQSILKGAASAGFTATVFEAAQPGDTGAYNIAGGLAWNTAGGWGSIEMPFEALVIAQPTANAFPAELWENLGDVAPAGGAVWLRVSV